jgi:hypothetical protein
MTARRYAARDQRKRPPPPIQITPTDVQLLRTLYDFRLMTTAQAATLIYRTTAQAYDRMNKLYHNAYLDRFTVGTVNTPLIYTLDKGAIALLTEQFPTETFTLYAVNQRIKPLFAAHTLAVLDVRAAITRVLWNRGGEVMHWLGESELKVNPDRVYLAGERDPVTVIPDSWFQIAIPSVGTLTAALELDRQQMSSKRFQHKIMAYEQYHLEGGYYRRYNTSALRVLTVTLSETHLHTLKAATEAVTERELYFFALLDQITPDAVLDQPIWWRSHHREQLSLLSG